MAKSDKDLQDSVGNAMGEDLFGSPKRKSKTTTYSQSAYRSPAYNRTSYMWENDDQFDQIDEFDRDLRKPLFDGDTLKKLEAIERGHRRKSAELPEIWNDHSVILDADRMAALESSIETAINNALDDNNLAVQYSEMLLLRKVVNKAVADCIPSMKYTHGGTTYNVRLPDEK